VELGRHRWLSLEDVVGGSWKTLLVDLGSYWWWSLEDVGGGAWKTSLVELGRPTGK